MGADLDNLTQGQLARLLGLDARRVRQLEAAGVFQKNGSERKSGYNGPSCVKSYLDYKIASEMPPSVGEDAANIEQAELRVKNADAELKELKAAQLKGELIEVEYVERSLAQMFGNLRSRVLGMPAKLTPQLVSVPSPVKVKAILEKETRAACEELVKIASKTPKVEVEDD